MSRHPCDAGLLRKVPLKNIRIKLQADSYYGGL